MRPLLALALLTTPLLAASAQDAAQPVRFIACPVYRDADSGAKSGCWLATDPQTGRQWDVSLSPYKPDWNFAVLVEGAPAVASTDQPCGAPVLQQVRTSRLAGACTRHMLPAEGLPGRRYSLPPRNIRPLANPPAPPPGPYSARTFAVFFEFDRSFVTYQYGDYLTDQAAQWIRATHPRRLIITGYAATAPEDVSGQTVAERPELAQQRADTMALSLSRLFPGLEIETRAVLDAQVTDHPDADGIPGQSQRRAEISVEY